MHLGRRRKEWGMESCLAGGSSDLRVSEVSAGPSCPARLVGLLPSAPGRGHRAVSVCLIGGTSEDIPGSSPSPLRLIEQFHCPEKSERCSHSLPRGTGDYWAWGPPWNPCVHFADPPGHPTSLPFPELSLFPPFPSPDFPGSWSPVLRGKGQPEL